VEEVRVLRQQRVHAADREPLDAVRVGAVEAVDAQPPEQLPCDQAHREREQVRGDQLHGQRGAGGELADQRGDDQRWQVAEADVAERGAEQRARGEQRVRAQLAQVEPQREQQGGAAPPGRRGCGCDGG
jgi:hypothetical protein